MPPTSMPLSPSGSSGHESPSSCLIHGWCGESTDWPPRSAPSSSCSTPRFPGRVTEEQLPAAFACADVFVMLCRNRWAGLEQEGFGIVFVEAAACGVPSIAGASGGAAEAVLDGETGYVIDNPNDVEAVAG